MNLKKIISTAVAFAFTAIVALVLSSAGNASYTENQGTASDTTEQHGTTSPTVPQSVVFAGEKISLTAQDRRERMDRELLSFTYSHINTTLMIKRANRLFPIVEPILKECGVPDDFKYLMIIESNGDIEARSPAGAGGLWQFLEKTGREYGLGVNGEVDERYHIEKATRAACSYLKESYTKYGDWLTVAASYNTGRANVDKRIAAQKENKAIDLVLLPETSRYIFRLMAIKVVFSNPVEFGFIIRSSDLYPQLPIAKTITVDNTVASWANIAKQYNLTYLQLREANPWIRSTSLTNKGKKAYKVKIPDSKALHYNPAMTKAHNPNWVVK
ncbi:MAG: lytic transglycosylase domain-containing protein [Bacteroidaceae bacterium]|nr:lytic transglycosylase domain-containing protein [Bacteroidaceae bacterium]